jgi:hypothetical protein
MFEYILSMDFNIYMQFFAVGLIVQLFLLRKVLFAWFDPLFIYCLTNSCSIGFVSYLFWENRIDSSYFYPFLISNFCLILGLILGNKKINFTPSSLSSVTGSIDNNIFRPYSKQLTVILWIGIIIIIGGNLLLVAKFGTLPLLSENPDKAKILFRTEGFGTIYRLNDALLPICLAITLLKLFHPVIKSRGYQAIFLRIAFVVLSFFLLSGGSKGAILNLISLLFYIYIINKYFNRKQSQKMNLYVLILFALGISFAIFVFVQVSIAIRHIDPVKLLMIRLVGYGDVFYYFYTYDLRQAFENDLFGFVEYIFNPLLSLLRLSEYQTALGEQIITEAIGLTTNGFGVNPQHPIESLIYFGNSWFWVYSLAIGYVISIVRTKLLSFVLNKPNQLNFLFYIVLGFNILKLPSDTNLFFESLYSMLFIVVPLFLYIYIFLGAQLKSVKVKWK